MVIGDKKAAAQQPDGRMAGQLSDDHHLGDHVGGQDEHRDRDQDGYRDAAGPRRGGTGMRPR